MFLIDLIFQQKKKYKLCQKYCFHGTCQILTVNYVIQIYKIDIEFLHTFVCSIIEEIILCNIICSKYFVMRIELKVGHLSDKYIYQECVD